MREKFMIGFANGAKIPLDDAGEIWYDFARQRWATSDIIAKVELGGWEQGEREGYIYYQSRHVA